MGPAGSNHLDNTGDKKLRIPLPGALSFPLQRAHFLRVPGFYKAHEFLPAGVEVVGRKERVLRTVEDSMYTYIGLQ